MRRLLDATYRISGCLSALFLVGIALTIVAQILGRFVGVVIDSTEIAGFFLAGSTFTGLAYTFRHGAHIRVNLLIRFASGKLNRLVNALAVAMCAIVIALLTYSSFELVYFSYRFDDISPGLLAIPFWIPQSALAIGALMMLIALIDELVWILRGNVPNYIANESPLFEPDSAVDKR